MDAKTGFCHALPMAPLQCWKPKHVGSEAEGGVGGEGRGGRDKEGEMDGGHESSEGESWRRTLRKKKKGETKSDGDEGESCCVRCERKGSRRKREKKESKSDGEDSERILRTERRMGQGKRKRKEEGDSDSDGVSGKEQRRVEEMTNVRARIKKFKVSETVKVRYDFFLTVFNSNFLLFFLVSSNILSTCI